MSNHHAEPQWNHPASAAIYERAQLVIPGGTTRGSIAYGPHPLYAIEGDGARVRFEGGHEAVDFLNNFTTLVLGHRHPVVLAAAHRQLDRGNVLGAPTEYEGRLAQLLVDRLKGVDKVVFSTTGSEAVMVGLRVARAATGREIVAKFEGGYHGGYDHAKFSGMVSPDSWGDEVMPTAVPDTGGIPSSVSDQVAVMTFNRIDSVDRVLSKHKGSVAALIVEPVQGVGGVLPPNPGFLNALRERCDRDGIVLIFDEVITQRLAVGGAQEVYDVTPDLTVVSKVMSGGFPIAALGGRADLMSLLDGTLPEGPVVYHSGTYNANPLSAAASVATLEQIDRDAIARLNGLGDEARSRLSELFRTRSAPLSVTGVGSIFNIHFASSTPRSYRDVQNTDKEALRVFHLRMLNAGVMLATRGLGCISLPMGEDEIAELENATAKVLSEMGW
ncbi:MAG: aspartate aminotransferase family protein [Acidimicrobiia bacterium]